jgi:SAM-dependent methyltransferase
MSNGAITSCRSCGAGGLRTFLSLGRMPLTDAYVTADRIDQPEKRYPLDIAFCPACSMVQILQTVPPEEMFVEYFYYSSVSQTLLEHSRLHAEELIATRGLGPDSLVVEVASNDGYLLQNFVNAGIPVLGIDPAVGPAKAAEAAGVPTLREFFGADLAARLRAEGKRADVVLANNVLAHVPDPNGFVAGIATILAEDGIAEIEAPYMKDLVDNLEFDTIYHEHLSYFSVTAASHLFQRHGLSLNHIRHLPIHGGSFRFTLGKNGHVSDSVRSLLAEDEAAGLTEFEFYGDFGRRVRRVQGQLKDLLDALKGGWNRIAAYGAAAKGTILLNSSGIGADMIDFVADMSPHKQGMFLPGVRIPIAPPERILEEMPDYVLLLAWNYKDEIMRQESEYLQRGGKFIVPIPRPIVVGKRGVAQASNGSHMWVT